jgi:toxin ParE1/3/4
MIYAFAKLQLPPKMGVPTYDPTIRRLTVLPYPFLIFYEVADDEILIHAIRHAARNPSGMPGDLT